MDLTPNIVQEKNEIQPKYVISAKEIILRRMCWYQEPQQQKYPALRHKEVERSKPPQFNFKQPGISYAKVGREKTDVKTKIAITKNTPTS